MTGEEKRAVGLLLLQCGWEGHQGRQRERGRRAGGRAGLPVLSPAPACLDKTHWTCGGISMRHHTWRKRQLNPAPSTTGPGSTKSSQHLEWISGDAADFTATSRVRLTLLLFFKNAQWKVAVKIKQESHRGFVFVNKCFSRSLSFYTVSHLLGIMLLCCW